MKTGDKINVLIIGSGHYSTGFTVLDGKRKTDKDMGVIFPSIIELKKQGYIGEIFLATREGKKVPELRKKIVHIQKIFGTNYQISLFPAAKKVQEDAYLEALSTLPKPGAVLIATPDHTHKQMIIETIRNGFHFMVVKPAVTKTKDINNIINFLGKRRLLGLVDYHKVYDEQNLLLRDEYLRGNYGQIQHIFTKMTQRKDMISIFKNWAGSYGNNVNHYLGSHYIHLVSFITRSKPLNVRATSQYGVVINEYGINTPDLIETQIEWLLKNGNKFSSYHVAGWSDPPDTASMTYQELHMITTKGHVEIDQRLRGYQTTLREKGQEIINPYFFSLHKGINGNLNLESRYGFRSIKVFIESVIEVENGKSTKSFEAYLPTIIESLTVTSILEAADKSLANRSSVVKIKN